MQRLSDILSLLGTSLDDSTLDCVLTGVSDDSRQVQVGHLFLACPGERCDGRLYIPQAIAAGAAACLVESASVDASISYLVPVIYVHNLRSKLAVVAKHFYPMVEPVPAFFGVTGTNGKTSCVQFFAQLQQAMGQRTAVLGTVGNGIWPQLQSSPLTTLGVLALQRHLQKYTAASVDTVALEVSSHALDQSRVAAIDFTVALFTGLSRDHLDYHRSMQAYGAAKAKLFQTPSLPDAVINWDDPFAQTLLQAADSSCQWYGVSLQSRQNSSIPMVFPRRLECLPHGFLVELSSPWGETTFLLPLLGRFNVTNVMLVITACCVLGYDFDRVCAAVEYLQPVSGRMQLHERPGLPRVVVDYAHTPDALKQSLQALHEHCTGNIWCVFGCGGERDRGKRRLMAEVAQLNSHAVIVTSDNSRGEPTERIMQDICAGFSSMDSVWVESDRKQALLQAVSRASVGDVILLAGRGHETHQVIADQVIAGTDGEWVEQVFDVLEHGGIAI